MFYILYLLVYAKDFAASDSKNQRYVAPFQNWYHYRYKHGAFIRPDVWKSKYGKRSVIDILQSTVVVHFGMSGAGTTAHQLGWLQAAGPSFISSLHLSKGDDDLSVVN
jgi:hypothetical protein